MHDSPVLTCDRWGEATLCVRICDYMEYGLHFLPELL